MTHLKKLVLALLLIGVVTISGCVSIEEHVKVSSDGTIESMTLVLEMPRTVYSLMVQNTTTGTFCGDIRANITSDLKDKVTCEESFTGDNVTITIHAEHVKPKDNADFAKGIEIYKENGYLIFKDNTWHEESAKDQEDIKEYGSLVTIDYYLEMPGKIIDSNAHKVDGNKAEWHLDMYTASKTPIYAKSEIPNSSICGPGIIMALAVIPLLMMRRKRA